MDLKIPCRIGVGHKARVGKDEFCDYIKKNRKRLHVLRISEPVYELATEIKKTLIRIGYKKFFENSEQVKKLMAKEVNNTVTEFIAKKIDSKAMEVYFWKKSPEENENTKMHMSVFTSLIFNKITGDLPDKQIYQKEIDDVNAKCRFLLQLIGDSLRVLWPNIWINILETKKLIPIIEKDPDADFAIPDVRYKNEIGVLRTYGFKIIDVNRPNRPMIENPNHPSETDLDDYDDWDDVIDNTGTIGQYHFKIKELLKKLNM